MQSLKKYALVSMIIFNFTALMVLYQSSNASQPTPENQVASQAVNIWKSDIESPDSQRQEEIARAIQTHQAPLFKGESPFTGPESSATNLAVFFDYQCIHCKVMAPILETLQRQNPTLKIIYKELPILGSNSTYAAKAALAAHKQAKYAMVSTQLLQSEDLSKNAILKIVENAGINMQQFQSDVDSPEIESTLDHNLNVAKDLTIKGTPVILITQNLHNPNEDRAPAFFIMGNTSLETLQALIYQAQDSTSS